MTAHDEGGEAPCFAHLLDEPMELTDAVLAELVHELADAVVIADAEGTITFWNAAATRVFGWPADEAIGHNLDIIIPERLRERHCSGYAQTMTTGHTKYGNQLLEVPALHRDGHTLSIAFTVTPIQHPTEQRLSGIAAVLRDNTAGWHERKQLRHELDALRSSRATAT